MRKGRASSVSTLKANLLLAFIFLPLPLLWITGLPLNISNRTEKRKADRSAPAELLCRVFDPAVAVIAASRQREPGFISAPALFCQQQRLLVAPGAEQHGQLPAAVMKGAAVIFPYPGTTWEQQWKPLSTLAGKGPEENRTWRKRSHPSFQRRGYTGLVTAPPLSVSSYSAHRNSRAKCLEQTCKFRPLFCCPAPANPWPHLCLYRGGGAFLLRMLCVALKQAPLWLTTTLCCLAHVQSCLSIGSWVGLTHCRTLHVLSLWEELEEPAKGGKNPGWYCREREGKASKRVHVTECKLRHREQGPGQVRRQRQSLVSYIVS